MTSFHRCQVLIGTGIDIVEKSRIESVIQRYGQRFIERVFTVDEARTCNATPARRIERFAARFAAKEAVLKSIGTGLTGGIRWTDVEIASDPKGKPWVKLTGEAARKAANRGITTIEIALSHAKQYAVASAIAMGVDDVHAR